MARPLRRPVDLFADRPGGDGALACEVEYQVRDLAPQPYCAGGGRGPAGLSHMVGWGFYLTAPWKRALWIGLTIFWLGSCSTCAS